MDDAALAEIAERCGWSPTAVAKAIGANYNGGFRGRLERLSKRIASQGSAPSACAAPPPGAVLLSASTVEGKPKLAANSDAPAWQGYRPRSGWQPPGPARVAGARAEDVRRTVVLADVHAPSHDRTAWACALGIVRELAPHRVVVDGDFLDLESLSRHPKARPDLTRLSAEWYSGNVMLDELQEAAGSAEVVYLEGNHEARAARYCLEFGPLDGVLDVAQSLYLAPRSDYHRETAQLRGVRWVPLRMQPFDLDGVGYLHGVFECIHHAAAHANGLGPRSGLRTLVTAHMHAWQSFTSNAGFSAFACPWLGDPSQPVFAYTKGRPRPWSQGVLEIEQARDSVSVSLIAIERGRALAAGRVVQAA